nr:hypothetical protein [uncultured Dysosmobacter sp.]
MGYIDDTIREMIVKLRSGEADLATAWGEAAKTLADATRLAGIKAAELEAALLNLGKADPLRRPRQETSNWRKMHGLPMRRRRAGRKGR